MRVCRLCEKSSDFADSHTIPKSFFVQLREEGLPPLIVSSNIRNRNKKSPIGVYDQKVLCKECEKRFNLWDDYGKRVLQDKAKPAVPIEERRKLAGYTMANIDIPLLRMFFISVLWRASVSEQDYYRRISLGPFEPLAKTRILESNPGTVDEFAVFLSKWDSTWVLSLADPYMTRIEGINTAIFSFLDILAYIKVDKRAPPPIFRDFVLGRKNEIFFFNRNFASSRERALLSYVIKRKRPQ